MAITGDITIGKMGSPYVYDSNQWNSIVSNVETNNTTLLVPESGKVIIGDLTMTAQEFKVCMKMLHKMALQEMPEEFI